MSTIKYNSHIEHGDDVVLYFGFNRMKILKVQRGATYQTQYGALRHNDVIGQQYGSRVKCSKGWLYVMHLTPELWTITLPHRTQILYTTDISMVIMQLDIKPGCTVIESGTGSGSLSHAIIRSIAPSGHLYTFDFHEQRVNKAKEEFVDHGVEDLVTIQYKDVLADGFGLKNIADAVFLDLPSPWDALPHAKSAIKAKGGRICSFSPCIEQVQRTCERLGELGFDDVCTMECLVRDYNIQTINMTLPDLGWDCPREKQPGLEGIINSQGGVPEPVVGQIVGQNSQNISANKSGEDLPKTEAQELIDGNEETSEEVGADDTQSKKTNLQRRKRPWEELAASEGHYQFKSAVPSQTIPGHTGFLTFATLIPSSSPNNPSDD